MAKLMISVAGIRGVVGDSLVPEEFLKLTAAYATTRKERTIVVGGDTRPTRHLLRHLVFGAAMATGCRVIDLGVCPTPTIGFMVKRLGAGGGIAITASHNPLEWNALKFFSDEGVFLKQPEMNKVLECYESGSFDYRPYSEIGAVETHDDPCGAHMEKVLDAVDVEAIKARNYTVAIDLCNGAGTAMLPELLETLGCRVVSVFDDTDAAFERVAEPLPENLDALASQVVASNADIGFAVDPDADRLAIVDETGRPIGEERTLTLAARHVLSRMAKPTPLVANLSTTRAIDDVAAEFGTTVERTRIGEAHVVDRILSVGAAIGGEGNGGVIYPAVHPGRDAATGIALILEAMALGGVPISEINGAVPDYVMVKNKVGVEGRDIDAVFGALRDAFSDAEFDTTDGLKILWDDAWVHVRPSGTEPIVRVYVEAPDRDRAEALAARAMEAAGS